MPKITEVGSYPVEVEPRDLRCFLFEEGAKLRIEYQSAANFGEVTYTTEPFRGQSANYIQPSGNSLAVSPKPPDYHAGRVRIFRNINEIIIKLEP